MITTVAVVGVGMVFLIGMMTGTTLQSRQLRRLVRRLARERRAARGPTDPDEGTVDGPVS